MTNYRFEPVASCNMCGADSKQAKVLGLRLNRSQGLRPRLARGVAVTVVRCRDCGLIFADPQPVPDSLESHYAMSSEDYFVDDMRSFGQTSPDRISRFRKLRGFLPQGQAPRAIDVGVGTGSSMRAMIEAGFDAFGFEPVPQFRDRALQALQLDPSKIALAGIEDAEFEPGLFDLVSFGAVLEHLPNPAASIEKVLAWLKPGGIVYAEVPNARHLIAKVINAFFAVQRANMVTHLSPMHSPFHLYEFNRRSFERHGAQHGYVIADCDYEIGTVRNVPRFTHPLFRLAMRTTRRGLQMHVVLRKS